MRLIDKEQRTEIFAKLRNFQQICQKMFSVRFLAKMHARNFSPHDSENLIYAAIYGIKEMA